MLLFYLKNKTRTTAAYSLTTKHNIETLYYKVNRNKHIFRILNPRFADTLSPRCLQGVHTHFSGVFKPADSPLLEINEEMLDSLCAIHRLTCFKPFRDLNHLSSKQFPQEEYPTKII